jgi:hypothetical protein
LSSANDFRSKKGMKRSAKNSSRTNLFSFKHDRNSSAVAEPNGLFCRIGMKREGSPFNTTTYEFSLLFHPPTHAILLDTD